MEARRICVDGRLVEVLREKHVDFSLLDESKKLVIDGELSVEEVVDEDAKQRLIEDLENQYDEMDVED